MSLDALAGKTLLGRYRVVMPIGRGGMGVVYLARTEGAAGFAKPVVIKSVHAELIGDPMMVQLFAREARLLSNLHHPGIVNVLDFGEEDGTYVMVLEYVHGYDLGAWGRYREQVCLPFPVDDVLHIAISVLDTLSYTHRYQRPDGTKLSIVHRDISPGNILISLDGQVKVADFGIARASDDAGEYRSKVGTFKGKLAYSAPELVQGSDPTPSADIYSLAVVMMQVLLGENPFRGQTMGDTVQRVLTLSPPSVSGRRRDVPPELDRVLARALAKDPSQRFDDAAALAHELRRLRALSDEAGHASFVEHVRVDFDGNLAGILDLDPLVDRDSAWRHDLPGTPVALSSTPPATRRPSRVDVEMTTAVLRDPGQFDAATVRPPEPQPEPQPRRGVLSRRIAVGGAALLAIVGAAALGFTLRPREEPLVGGSYYVADTASAPVVVRPPPTDSAVALPATASAAVTGSDPASLITAALAERQPEVERCFERHVSDLTGAPELGLRFQLAASGAVRSVEVTPQTLEGTPLGDCLVGVARKTHFPPLGRDVSFRLPITAHVSR